MLKERRTTDKQKRPGRARGLGRANLRAGRIERFAAHGPVDAIGGSVGEKPAVLVGGKLAWRNRNRQSVSIAQECGTNPGSHPHAAPGANAQGGSRKVSGIDDRRHQRVQFLPSSQPPGSRADRMLLVGSALFVHTVLARDAHTEELLGCAYQQSFVRQPAPAKETKRQRARVAGLGAALRSIGPVPSCTQWIYVRDRGSDIFPFWQA